MIRPKFKIGDRVYTHTGWGVKNYSIVIGISYENGKPIYEIKRGIVIGISYENDKPIYKIKRGIVSHKFAETELSNGHDRS
jgi:uncharacterized protein YwbE